MTSLIEVLLPRERGTTKMHRLEENLGALNVTLTVQRDEAPALLCGLRSRLGDRFSLPPIRG